MSSQDEKFEEVLTWLKDFFEEIKGKPCYTFEGSLVNKMGYREFRNEAVSLMVTSTFRQSQLPERRMFNPPHVLSGWFLDIVQFSFSKEYQRKGYGLKLARWIYENTPTEFIFLQSVLSKAAEQFLVKHQEEFHLTRCLYSHADYTAEKGPIDYPRLPFGVREHMYKE
jgi:hypothetical protein